MKKLAYMAVTAFINGRGLSLFTGGTERSGRIGTVPAEADFQNKKLACLAIAAFITLASGCGESRSGEEIKKALSQRNSPGTEAVEFIARGTDDKFISLSDLRGKVVLMTFWRKKCATCFDHLDSLEALYQKLKGRDFTILAINGDNLNYVPSSKIREIIQERGYTFPVLLDDEFAVSEKYRVIEIPATYLIDKEGIISYVKMGTDDWTSEENIGRVEKMLSLFATSPPSPSAAAP